MPVTGGGRVTATMTQVEIDGLDLMVDRTRRLDYPVFDVDNHLYENRDALTKFVPAAYEGIIKYVDVAGRTKLAFGDMISDFIPNPTFVKVAPPGGTANDPQQRRAIASPDAFFDPDARLHLLRELGVDRVLMFPTLACLVEQRLKDDPRATHAVIHAYNEWLFEHWSYVYEDAIYTTPIIPLSIVSEAVRELEIVLERGAKAIQVRMAPVPGFEGPRSFALRVRSVLERSRAGRRSRRKPRERLGLHGIRRSMGGQNRPRNETLRTGAVACFPADLP
jgi:hypothetical protein